MKSQKIFVMMLLLAFFASHVPFAAFAQDEPTTTKKKKKKKKKEPEPEVVEEPEPEPEPEEEPEPDAEPAFTESLADDPANQAESTDSTVSLTDEFSLIRLGVDAVLLGGGAALILGGPSTLGQDATSIGAPSRESLDYDLSISFHGDLQDGSPFMFGASDIIGYSLVAIPGLWYASSALKDWATGSAFLDSQTDHTGLAFAGYFETMAYTAAATGLMKAVFARDRPYRALLRKGYDPSLNDDANDSFVAALTSFSFASAAYASQDLATWLIKQDISPIVAYSSSYLGLYGAATLVGLGQVYQQEAYFSDAMVGALVGTLVGNLVYATHFDDDGNPDSMAFAPTMIPTNDSFVAGIGVTSNW